MLEYQQRFKQTQQSLKAFMHCEFNSFTLYPCKYQMRSEITLLCSLIRPGVHLTGSDNSVWCNGQSGIEVHFKQTCPSANRLLQNPAMIAWKLNVMFYCDQILFNEL